MAKTNIELMDKLNLRVLIAWDMENNIEPDEVILFFVNPKTNKGC